MSKDKKTLQLGMNPSTASNRLVKDVLWKLVQQTGQDTCCKCGESMSRDTFSIEHLVPWLDSADPLGLYFDLGNISFSHWSCNFADRRRNPIVCGTSTKYNRGCRCIPCKDARSTIRRKHYAKSGR